MNDMDDGNLCNVLDSQSFDVKFLYILVSVYVEFIISSIILLLIFVDRLPTSNSFFSAEKKVELYLKKPSDGPNQCKDVTDCSNRCLWWNGTSFCIWLLHRSLEVGVACILVLYRYVCTQLSYYNINACILSEGDKTTEGHTVG